MSQFGLKAAQASVQASLKANRPEAALKVLIEAQKFSLPVTQAPAWLELWNQLPSTLLTANIKTATAYTIALARADLDVQLLEFTTTVLEHFPEPELAILRSERAWALTCQGRLEEALLELQQALERLEGTERGRALRRLIWVRQRLGLSWTEFIPEAQSLLVGLSLGVFFLDVGNCFLFEMRFVEAREVWLDALGLLQPDPILHSRCHTQIGNAFLAECLPEAEYHFLKASEIAGNARHNSPRYMLVKAAQCNAWVGLGMWHCIQGQYRRAENAFAKGLCSALTSHDRVKSRLGLARLQRIQRNHSLALETLSEILAEPSHLHQEMYLERAANFALMHRIEDTTRALTKITGVTSMGLQNLERIVRAEIFRLSKQEKMALGQLEGLELNTRVTREEAMVFQELFSWYQKQGNAIPTTLVQQPKTSIRVLACGALRIEINQQVLPLDPSAKTGLALVALLEQPGYAIGAERLSEMLWERNENDARNLRERLLLVGDVIRNLRELLRDPKIIRTAKNTYHLDLEIDWHYDAAQVRAGKGKCKVFLEGVYLDWVIETTRELQNIQLEQNDNRTIKTHQKKKKPTK